MTPMTDEQYVAKMGGHCPYCDSTNLTGGSFDIAGDSASQEICCSDCGRNWADVYKLTGYDPLDD